MEYNFMKSLITQVDRIDNEILILLKRRFQLAKKIAKYNLDNDIKTDFLTREDEIFKHISKIAIEMSLPESSVRNLFRIIVDESKLQEQMYMNKLIKNKKK